MVRKKRFSLCICPPSLSVWFSFRVYVCVCTCLRVTVLVCVCVSAIRFVNCTKLAFSFFVLFLLFLFCSLFPHSHTQNILKENKIWNTGQQKKKYWMFNTNRIVNEATASAITIHFSFFDPFFLCFSISLLHTYIHTVEKEEEKR